MYGPPRSLHSTHWTSFNTLQPPKLVSEVWMSVEFPDWIDWRGVPRQFVIVFEQNYRLTELRYEDKLANS